MIKICTGCNSTWAGGRICEDCGATLRDPYGEEASALPPAMWRYIRLQYGARRGMIVRVLGLLFGPLTFGYTLRIAAGHERPWSILLAFASIPIGVFTWWSIHWFSGRAVRIWVLRKGQLNRRRMARAIARRAFGK